MERVRRRLVLLVLALALMVAGPPIAAAAQDDPTTTVAPIESPSIIPEPNSGRAPTDAGDRGGALQTALFVAIVGGVIVITGLVARESRKARSERGF